MSDVILGGIGDLGRNATLDAHPNPITAAWEIDKARIDKAREELP